MTAAAVIEFPVVTLADLSSDIDRLASLQKQAAEIEKMARQLRARIREGMSAKGLDAFLSAGGHRASLFSTTRFEADRKEALRILSAELVSAIFRPTTSITLRVK